MSIVLFQFQCQRKHLLFNSTYKVQVHAANLYLIKNKQKSIEEAKYKLLIALGTQIYWQGRGGKLISFGFIYSGKLKYFEAGFEDLKEFKRILAGQVMFKDIEQVYLFQYPIGKGASSQVYIQFSIFVPIYIQVYTGQNRFNEETCAIKQISKKYLIKANDSEFIQLFSEISLMKSLKHPQIMGFNSCYEDSNHYYLILDKMKGQSLSYVTKMQCLTEMEIQEILQQILKGVQFLHSKGIIHRDLKPDNIMFKQENLTSLKIVDFGLSVNKFEQSPRITRCGTAGYVAPEVLNSSHDSLDYDERCDIFSIGAIAFKLLTGLSLIPGKSANEIFQNTVNGKFNMGELSGENLLNASSIDLIKQLTQLDYKQRITSDQALNHPFFSMQNIKVDTKKKLFQKIVPPSPPSLILPSEKTIHQAPYNFSPKFKQTQKNLFQDI